MWPAPRGHVIPLKTLLVLTPGGRGAGGRDAPKQPTSTGAPRARVPRRVSGWRPQRLSQDLDECHLQDQHLLFLNVALLLCGQSFLLLCRFSRVRLCASPEMAAHQAPPSLGFSRQEHWSGLPFPSPMHESEKWKWSSFLEFSKCSPKHRRKEIWFK